MRIEHIALWTRDLERFKRFYVDYFGAAAGSGYVNPAKGFASCFLSFGHGVITRVAHVAPAKQHEHGAGCTDAGAAAFCASDHGDQEPDEEGKPDQEYGDTNGGG